MFGLKRTHHFLGRFNMKKKVLVLTIGTLVSQLVLSSCGKHDSSDQSTEAQKAPQTEANLPEGTIIAVPVSADGTEEAAYAQMRVLQTAPVKMSSDSAAMIFQQGQEPERLVDELDQTSSTASFNGWQNYRQVGYESWGSQGYDDRYERRYGHHRPNRGCRGYQYYQPTYYNRGNIFSWMFQNRYQTPGMNYYYYQRPTIWPYSQQQNQYPYGQTYGNQNPYGRYDDSYNPTPVTPYPSTGFNNY